MIPGSKGHVYQKNSVPIRDEVYPRFHSSKDFLKSSLEICNVDNTYPAKSEFFCFTASHLLFSVSLLCFTKFTSPNQLPNALQKTSCKRCFQPLTSSLCCISFFYFFVLCLFPISSQLTLAYENPLNLSIDLHNFIDKYACQNLLGKVTNMHGNPRLILLL